MTTTATSFAATLNINECVTSHCMRVQHATVRVRVHVWRSGVRLNYVYVYISPNRMRALMLLMLLLLLLLLLPSPSFGPYIMSHYIVRHWS